MKTVSDKGWVIREKAPKQVSVDLAGFSPVMRQLLYARGMDSVAKAEKFFDMKVSGMNDPFLFRDMEKAVKRIVEAGRKGEKVLIFGDYDADGVSGTTLLRLAFEKLGIDTLFHVPHRREEGYGLSVKVIKETAEQGVGLIVTVDCGSRNHAEVAKAVELGIDVVVTDHHEVPDGDPGGVAFINPKNPEDEYPFEDLSGVGVAYKLVEAIFEKAGKAKLARKFFDLVAIGTVADVMPIVGENRIFVKKGLEMMRDDVRPGLMALLDNARVQGHQLDARSIGFIIGPRINAAGRMDDAKVAVDLLSAGSYEEALDPAKKLEKLNQARQRDTEKIFLEVKKRVSGEERIIFADDASWSQGIVGLVANKLVEEYGRPAIVLERGEKESKGSARSIPGFSMAEVIKECDDMLEKSGGHEMAAGFTVRNDKLDDFRKKVEELAERNIDSGQKTELVVDAEVEASFLDIGLYEELRRLEPFGEGNERPRFVLRDVAVEKVQLVGQTNNHLRMLMRCGGKSLKSIGFRKGKWSRNVSEGDKIDVVFELDKDDWMGADQVQLLLVDFSYLEKVKEAEVVKEKQVEANQTSFGI